MVLKARFRDRPIGGAMTVLGRTLPLVRPPTLGLTELYIEARLPIDCPIWRPVSRLLGLPTFGATP